MWIVHVYWWLEANNLWKSAVAFWATMVLGAGLSLFLRPWRLWKQRKRTQHLREKIADHLDSGTPGGITDLIRALREATSAKESAEADDNGTDYIARLGHHHGNGSSRGR